MCKRYSTISFCKLSKKSRSIDSDIAGTLVWNSSREISRHFTFGSPLMKYSQVSWGQLAMICKRSTTRELKRPPRYRSSLGSREVPQTSNALRVEGGATRLGSSIIAEKSRSSTKNICLSKNDRGNIVNRTDLERS